MKAAKLEPALRTKAVRRCLARSGQGKLELIGYQRFTRQRLTA
jgi:hypothetical protein